MAKKSFEKSFIDGIRVLTHANHLDVSLYLSCNGAEGYSTEVSLASDECTLAFGAAGVKEGRSCHSLLPSPVQFWLPQLPRLYNLDSRLLDKAGCVVDSKTLRIGFRDAAFCDAGFFLNGQMILPATIDLRAKAADPHDVKHIKARGDVNLVLCRIDENTDAFLSECDRQGALAATLLPAGYEGIDVSRAILRLGWHPSLCAWLVDEISWGKKIAPELANEDPHRALLHIDLTTGNTLILGGKGEKTRMAGGIKLVG